MSSTKIRVKDAGGRTIEIDYENGATLEQAAAAAGVALKGLVFNDGAPADPEDLVQPGSTIETAPSYGNLGR